MDSTGSGASHALSLRHPPPSAAAAVALFCSCALSSLPSLLSRREHRPATVIPQIRASGARPSGGPGTLRARAFPLEAWTMSPSAPRSSPPVCTHMLGACAHSLQGVLSLGFRVRFRRGACDDIGRMRSKGRQRQKELHAHPQDPRCFEVKLTC